RPMSSAPIPMRRGATSTFRWSLPTEPFVVFNARVVDPASLRAVAAALCAASEEPSPFGQGHLECGLARRREQDRPPRFGCRVGGQQPPPASSADIPAHLPANRRCANQEIRL